MVESISIDAYSYWLLYRNPRETDLAVDGGFRSSPRNHAFHAPYIYMRRPPTRKGCRSLFIVYAIVKVVL